MTGMNIPATVAEPYVQQAKKKYIINTAMIVL